VPKLGITVTPQHDGNGVTVSKVDPDGAAADRGLKNGDVILEAGGRKVTTAVNLRNAIDAAQRPLSVHGSIFLSIASLAAVCVLRRLACSPPAGSP
jgi:membrane-associated protease RseP (regulator of RpoE activity)